MSDKKMSPLKAIKTKCLECSNNQIGEVRNCTITDCALYPFRKGHNPYIHKNLTEEQKNAARDRLLKNRPHK